MTTTLKQCTVALAEGRQLDDLARMFEQEGATAVRCPMVSIIDAPDAEPVVDWIRALVGGAFKYVIFYTGEGIRRLLGFAERNDLRDDMIVALRNVRTVTRGPKPVRALQEIQLKPSLTATRPTTAGVIDAMQNENVQGKSVGVQLFDESIPPVVEFLQSKGAEVRTVLPYQYAPAADAERIADLISQITQGEIDVIVFTSSPQVDRLWAVAKEKELQADLEVGVQKTKVAAVGPVVADSLRENGVTVDICPEQGFVMKNLVNHIKRSLEESQAD